MKNSIKRKLVIIGIDGGTFKVIDPLIEKGKLPNLEKIIKSGVKGILKSTYPPITAAAWVSFMTGKNPGKHGFFDFREYNPKEYTPAFFSETKDAIKENVSTLHSSRFQGETIWDFLSKAGYEMTVVAVPMTYPPWKINGRMVAGFPCPDYKKPKTYPPEWGKEIGQLFNISAINYSKIDGFIKECKELVGRKGKIILEQLRKKRGEIYSVVFSSTDFTQHYFWKYLEVEGHRYSHVIEEIYKEVDKILGEILNLIDESTSIFILSDHGFMNLPKKYFNMNSWLLKGNYIYLKAGQSLSGKNIFSKAFAFLSQTVTKNISLKMTIIEKIGRMPDSIQKWVARQHFKSNLIDWNRTKAFRFRMYATVDGIVINQQGRQENGIVREGQEYEKLREEIIMELLEIRDPDNGQRIIEGAFRREEIYSGSYIENAPDVIINFNPDYISGNELGTELISLILVETSDVFTGIHSQDGLCILYGPNIKKGVQIEPADIIDITPTILYDLNLPIPDDIDGKIIEDAFLESYKINLSRYITIKKETKETEEGLSREDEESMKKALEGLGYLE